MAQGGRQLPLGSPRRMKSMAPVFLAATVMFLAAAGTLSLAAAATSGAVASSADSPRAAADSGRAKREPPLLYRPIGCKATSSSQVYFHGPPRKAVAIGFDDGPAADTRSFVTMLERERIPATFFLIGEQVTSTYGATLRDELRAGYALGDHTFTHPDLTRSGNVYGQLENTIKAIRAQTGYTPCVFRPPYGAFNPTVVQTARSLGLATVQWNVDPTDWALPGTAAIEQRVLAQVRPGSIILSHDGGGPRGQTLAAYPHIIAGLRARGYRFETIPQLLGFRTIYRRCRELCDGEGVPGPVPAGSIVEPG